MFFTHKPIYLGVKLLKISILPSFSGLLMNYLSNKFYINKKNDLPLYLFLFAGTAFRLFHFFYNRSLWMDEVYLSTSLVKMNYSELVTMPLYYQQKAPIGFLLLVKFIVNLFGNKEMYLRIIPVLSGVLSMYLFIPVAKYFLSKWGAYVAMAILCFSPALVYHSVEVKQYSTELLGTILCLLMLIRYKTNGTLRIMFFWGILGALILWFSYSSIFILAGIAIGLSLKHIIYKRWNKLFLNIIPFFMWLFSFSINYILFTHKHSESEWIVYWFRSYGNFMPLFPKSTTDLMWFPANLYRMIDYPLGMLWNFNNISDNHAVNMMLKMPLIGIGLLLAGILILFKRYRANSFILIPPIILTLITSGLELYPLTERFWVFISPVFIILIAIGFQYLTGFIKSSRMIFLLFALVIAGPFIQSAEFIIKPKNFFVHKKSFQREALMYVNNHIKHGDIVYVYWNNIPGYNLYKEIYHFDFNAVEGRDVRKRSTNFNSYYNNLKPDFDQLSAASRIWLIFNTQFLTDIGDKIDDPEWYYKNGASPTNPLLKEFSKFGKITSRYTGADIAVYLIEPNDKANQEM